MNFDSIFCQNKAISMLKNAFFSSKIPHAYIFSGSEGVGKSATAAIWAKLLLCQNPDLKNAISCCKCDSCRLFESGSHPDFVQIYKELLQFTKEGKDKTTPVDISIDVIREIFIPQVFSRPSLSEKKAFIILEAERLNAASQNAILKTLEEPPPFCHIILICKHLDKLLPTIKSRCQIIRFNRISEEKISEHLQKLGLSTEKAGFYARFSEGSIGIGAEYAKLEQANTELYQLKKLIVDWFTNYKYSDSLDLAAKLLEQSKELSEIWTKLEKDTSKTDINRRCHKIIIKIIISILSDAMKLPICGENIINSDQIEKIELLSNRISPQKTAQLLEQTCEFFKYVDSSVNEKLIFERLLLNFADSATMKV